MLNVTLQTVCTTQQATAVKQEQLKLSLAQINAAALPKQLVKPLKQRPNGKLAAQKSSQFFYFILR